MNPALRFGVVRKRCSFLEGVWLLKDIWNFCRSAFMRAGPERSRGDIFATKAAPTQYFMLIDLHFIF
jgi:hypothetical protein